MCIRDRGIPRWLKIGHFVRLERRWRTERSDITSLVPKIIAACTDSGVEMAARVLTTLEGLRQAVNGSIYLLDAEDSGLNCVGYFGRRPPQRLGANARDLINRVRVSRLDKTAIEHELAEARHTKLE